MIVCISPLAEIELREPNDFRKFHIEIEATADRLPVLSARLSNSISFTDDSNAWVSASALHHFRGAPGDPSWRDNVAAMIDKVRPHGWIQEAPLAIKAHIVWKP